MRVSQLLAGTDLSSPISSELSASEVAGLAYDSRMSDPDTCSSPSRERKADGRQFAGDAVAKGALAVVSELPQPEDFSGPWIRTAHARHRRSRSLPDGSRAIRTGACV